MIEQQKPRLIIVAGPNGAGKTTITERLLRHEWMEGCEYINPDFIAQNQFGDWNSPEAVIKAANTAKNIRENCLNTLTSMAFETVFSSDEKLNFVQRSKAAGFFIRLFFVCTNDPSIVDKILEINNSQLFDIEINGLSIKKLFVISSQRQIYRDEQKLLNLIKKFGLKIGDYRKKISLQSFMKSSANLLLKLRKMQVLQIFVNL